MSWTPSPVDLTLYLVTDRPLCLGRDLLDVVTQAVEGGVTLVQLREKTAEGREVVELARALKKILQPKGVPLIIDDRLDVALAADADGAHVGQQDIHAADARAILGPDRILGLTIKTEDQVREAHTLPVDYLGVGPIFPTQTKKNMPVGPWGVEKMRAMAQWCTLPFVAIGGIKTESAADVIAGGAPGIAVVSAICSADDPRQASAGLLDQIRAGRAR